MKHTEQQKRQNQRGNISWYSIVKTLSIQNKETIPRASRKVTYKGKPIQITDFLVELIANRIIYQLAEALNQMERRERMMLASAGS